MPKLKFGYLVLFGFWILSFGFSVQAQDLGARPMGFGGAFMGLADDANAVFSNPAGIGLVSKESATASTRLLEGTNYSMIAGVETTDYGSFGVGYVASTSTSQEAQQTLYLSLARNLNQAMVIPENMGLLSLGVNLQIINQKNVAARYDGKVGVIFKPADYISFGVAAGKRDLKSGVSGNLFNNKITWTAEQDKVGCEWKPVDLLAFRVGTNSSGVGVKVNGVAIDYAYSNQAHYWSVGVL
ncbi:MAG: hypothetical protein ABIH50_06710 [bacterium]